MPQLNEWSDADDGAVGLYRLVAGCDLDRDRQPSPAAPRHSRRRWHADRANHVARSGAGGAHDVFGSGAWFTASRRPANLTRPRREVGDGHELPPALLVRLIAVHIALFGVVAMTAAWAEDAARDANHSDTLTPGPRAGHGQGQSDEGGAALGTKTTGKSDLGAVGDAETRGSEKAKVDGNATGKLDSGIGNMGEHHAISKGRSNGEEQRTAKAFGTARIPPALNAAEPSSARSTPKSRCWVHPDLGARRKRAIGRNRRSPRNQENQPITAEHPHAPARIAS